MTDIPKGWVEATLGEIATFKRGFDLTQKERGERRMYLLILLKHTNLKIR